VCPLLWCWHFECLALSLLHDLSSSHVLRLQPLHAKFSFDVENSFR
jgi:hypothetical protein